MANWKNKIKLISLNFSMIEIEKIKKTKKQKQKLSGVLSTTAIDLFYALNEFGK